MDGNSGTKKGDLSCIKICHNQRNDELSKKKNQMTMNLYAASGTIALVERFIDTVFLDQPTREDFEAVQQACAGARMLISSAL